MRTKKQWRPVLAQAAMTFLYLASIKIGLVVGQSWFSGIVGGCVLIFILWNMMPQDVGSMIGLAMRPVFSAFAIVLIAAAANPLRPDLHTWSNVDWVMWVVVVFVYAKCVPGISRESIREYADLHGVSAGDVTLKVVGNFVGLVAVSLGMIVQSTMRGS